MGAGERSMERTIINSADFTVDDPQTGFPKMPMSKHTHTHNPLEKPKNFCFWHGKATTTTKTTTTTATS